MSPSPHVFWRWRATPDDRWRDRLHSGTCRLGAALGDWVSYAIGFHLKERAHHVWPLSRRPELLPQAEAFFRRYGMLSVVLCRFFSPLRATVPLLCGVFEMPALRFQVANWLSAPIWAFALLAPGGLLAIWLR